MAVRGLLTAILLYLLQIVYVEILHVRVLSQQLNT